MGNRATAAHFERRVGKTRFTLYRVDRCFVLAGARPVAISVVHTTTNHRDQKGSSAERLRSGGIQSCGPGLHPGMLFCYLCPASDPLCKLPASRFVKRRVAGSPPVRKLDLSFSGRELFDHRK